MIVPLLKGRPKLFIKKTSEFPKKARVDGSNNLNIKSKIAIEIKFATMNHFKVTFL